MFYEFSRYKVSFVDIKYIYSQILGADQSREGIISLNTSSVREWIAFCVQPCS